MNITRSILQLASDDPILTAAIVLLLASIGLILLSVFGKESRDMNEEE